jgi:hypothetical protein
MEVWKKGWKENNREVKRIVGVYRYTESMCSCNPINQQQKLSEIPLR